MALNVGSLNKKKPKARPFNVPAQIEMAQTLATDRGSEKVRFTYSFDDGHDIFFKNKGARVKKVKRAATIKGPALATICHRFDLVRGNGKKLVSYELRQRVRDEANRATTRRKTLRIR